MLTSLAMMLLAVVCYGLLLFAGFLAYGSLCRRRRPTVGDYIVVLGSTLGEGGRVTPLLASRLDQALATAAGLRSHGADPVLVLAGGPKGPHSPVPESRAMADYLVERGADGDRLLCEDRSTSTEQNIRLAAQIMEQSTPEGYRCVIVTNDYHCPRVAVLARRHRVPGTLVGAHASATRWLLRDFAAFLALCWRPVLAGFALSVAVAGFFIW